MALLRTGHPHLDAAVCCCHTGLPLPWGFARVALGCLCHTACLYHVVLLTFIMLLAYVVMLCAFQAGLLLSSCFAPCQSVLAMSFC